MVAIQDISLGNQIFNTYGDISNSDLLFKYGFIDNVNEFNRVDLEIEEFSDFAREHCCIIHQPTHFKEGFIEKWLENGTIADTALLPAKISVPWDLLKWFQKLYPSQSSLKGKEALRKLANDQRSCIGQFLKRKMQNYKILQVKPANKNQQLVDQLVRQEICILQSYLDLLENQ